MGTEFFKNTFEGGVDLDSDPSGRRQNTYFDAFMVSLSNDNNKGILSNFRGTTAKSILFTAAEIMAGSPNNTRILGVTENTYAVGGTGERKDGLTIFTAFATGEFRIIFYNIVDENTTTIFTETYSPTLNNLAPVVDAVTYSEDGVDVIYFTDFFNTPRRIVCNTLNFPLTEPEIQLLRTGPEATVVINDVATGGELVAGAYQFSVRLVHNVANRYTKWTLLTNPAFVTGDGKIDIGEPTGFKVVLDLDFNSVTNYTHYQLAVVASIDGTINPSTIAVLDDPVVLTGVTMTHNYTSNTAVGVQIGIGELTIDDAAIKTWKTNAVKNNRLIVGNIEYHDLSYDHPSGDPVIGTTTTYVVKTDVAKGLEFYGDDDNASKFVGHFRDELYRYAVTYFDEFGNYSRPKVLSFSAVTANAATSGIDWRFPVRNTVAIISDVTNDAQTLGLDLQNLANHPTWAKGFVILRAKRKKNILFQTPYIPCIQIEPAAAIGDYPVQDRINTDAAVVLTDPVIPNPKGSVVPKNFFHVMAKSIERATADAGTIDVAGYIRKNEVQYLVPHPTAGPVRLGGGTGYLFAPEIMYEVSGGGRFGSYLKNQGKVMHTVDIAFLRLSESDKTTGLGSFDPGDFNQMEVAGLFYADIDDSYYYKDGASQSDVTAVATPTSNREIKEVISLENLDTGSIFSATSGGVSTPIVNDFAALLGTNLNDGVAPDSMRMYAVNMTAGKGDITNFCADAATGYEDSTEVATALSHFAGISSAFYIKDQNKFVYDEGGFTTRSSYVSAVEIVNIESGLDDDRYGAAEDLFEFQSTGAVYKFTSGELTTVAAGGTLLKDIEVWGGDCRVVPMSFKISNSTYSITNMKKIIDGTSDTETDATDKWGHWFEDGVFAGDDVMRPYPLKAVSQIIGVMLETEINVATAGVEGTMFIDAGMKVFTEKTTTPDSYRSPMVNTISGGLTKQNDQKIFFPFSSFENDTLKFPARLAWSDVKVYQTDTEGFDRFRVLNIFDMDATYGDIMKLALVGDKLFGLQRSGVTFIPTSGRVIEQTDASSLEIRSNVVVDTPVYLDTVHGCQTPQTIQISGDTMYYADRDNSKVFKLTGGQITNIGDIGLESFWLSRTSTDLRLEIDGFTDDIDNRDFMSGYDKDRDEYWVGRRFEFLWIYNNKIGRWVTRLPQLTTTYTLGAIRSLSRMFVFGAGAGSVDFTVNEIYNEDTSRTLAVYGRWYDTTVDGFVKFTVNPFPDIFKTYDNFAVNATERVKDITLDTTREALFDGSVPTQTTGVQSLAIASLEDTWRIKILRATGGERMRGKYGEVTINWANSTVSRKAGIISVLTKYRPSYKPQ